MQWLLAGHYFTTHCEQETQQIAGPGGHVQQAGVIWRSFREDLGFLLVHRRDTLGKFSSQCYSSHFLLIKVYSISLYWLRAPSPPCWVGSSMATQKAKFHTPKSDALNLKVEANLVGGFSLEK